jgi:hypothetical protein
MTRPNAELDAIINARFRMRGDVLLQRLQQIKERAFQDRSKLVSQYPDWSRGSDARLYSLGKIINIVERTQYLVNSIGKLMDDEWSDANLENETQRNQDYRCRLVVELEITAKYGFGMSFFTLIETYFRIFLRTIDPTACKNATAPFYDIYNILRDESHLNLTNSDWDSALELLEFIRRIRNLIHNDGVYYDDKGVDKKVSYRGTSYIFRNGLPVDFVTWELLLVLAEDIRQLLVQVISHPKIMQIATITDPATVKSNGPANTCV